MRLPVFTFVFIRILFVKINVNNQYLEHSKFTHSKFNIKFIYGASLVNGLTLSVVLT